MNLIFCLVSKVKISQNFVAFSEYMNFKNQVQTRQKIKFIQLDFLKLIFKKSSADR